MPGDLNRNPIRILIAEENAIIRQGLVALLSHVSDINVVCEATTINEAIDFFDKFLPDVLLIGLPMHPLTAVDAISAICRRFATAKLILLGTYEFDGDTYRGLRAGARAYMLKEADLEKLSECIRTVHDGKAFVPSRIHAKLAESVTNPELSSREPEFLRLMVRG